MSVYQPFEIPVYYQILDDVLVYPNKEPEFIAEGIDIRVVREYANRHNFTLQFKIEHELWGEVYPNRTGFGLFGSLVELKADVGIGAVGSWSNIRPYMEMSFPFVRTGVSCLVPVPR